MSRPWALLLANPHTGSPMDMVATAGVAVALIGLLTLLLPPGTALDGPVGGTLRAAGAAPLTIYTLHVVLTGVALILAVLLSDDGELTTYPWYVAGVAILLVHVALALGIGAWLRTRGRSGPLERLVSGSVKRIVPMR